MIGTDYPSGCAESEWSEHCEKQALLAADHFHKTVADTLLSGVVHLQEDVTATHLLNKYLQVMYVLECASRSTTPPPPSHPEFTYRLHRIGDLLNMNFLMCLLAV